jgi:hypothetical protein
LIAGKEVYNIEVDTNNNFYVGKGKVLVHNSRYVPIEELKKELLIGEDILEDGEEK